MKRVFITESQLKEIVRRSLNEEREWDEWDDNCTDTEKDEIEVDGIFYNITFCPPTQSGGDYFNEPSWGDGRIIDIEVAEPYMQKVSDEETERAKNELMNNKAFYRHIEQEAFDKFCAS